MALREVKLCLLGDSDVGKSNILLRFAKDQYQDNKEPTIGADFMTKRVAVGDKTFVFQIRDTPGMKRYRDIAPMIYRGAAAVIIVYDTTRESTYLAVKGWIQELRKNATKNLVIAIVGNKCDLTYRREVNANDARSYAEEIDALFAETSARNAINVQELFESIAKRLPAEEVDWPMGSSVYLKNNTTTQQEKRGCCGCSTT